MKHEPADLSTDIVLLMKSLADNSVYQIKGCVFAEGDGMPTLDVITIGIQQLLDSSSNPLIEYNSAFIKLQACHRLVPLVDDWAELETGGNIPSLRALLPPLRSLHHPFHLCHCQPPLYQLYQLHCPRPLLTLLMLQTQCTAMRVILMIPTQTTALRSGCFTDPTTIIDF
jgi:hypothetical protein